MAFGIWHPSICPFFRKNTMPDAMMYISNIILTFVEAEAMS
jgi:hypothetical protein